MNKRQEQFLDELPTYMGRYLNQIRWNPELMYYPVGAAVLQMALLKSSSPWAFVLFVLQYFVIGLFCVAGITRRIDRAFQSLPLNFAGAGYGKPRWVIEDGKPLKLQVLKIFAAGFSEADFVAHRDALASRLRLPIASIQKPRAEDPHIYVTIRKTELPSALPFQSLDLTSLESGEFYMGKNETELRKLSLTRMIHMFLAGQTGSGKTSFLKQMIATLIVRTSNIHLVIVDMKGGIDFQEFMNLKNVEIATDYDKACDLLDGVNAIFDERTKIILAEKKQKWAEIDTGKARKRTKNQKHPTGPIVVVVDELTELSKEASKMSANSDLQEKLSRIARLARVTGIHLVLATQKPDVNVLASQVKANLLTKVCFSVATIADSTSVIVFYE